MQEVSRRGCRQQQALFQVQRKRDGMTPEQEAEIRRLDEEIRKRDEQVRRQAEEANRK